MADLSVASLSPAQRRLLALMQELSFGRIEKLSVRGGEPAFDPPPRVVEEVKLGCSVSQRPRSGCGGFSLKAQVVACFAKLSQLGDGMVDRLEVKHGLPFRMNVQRKVRE